MPLGYELVNEISVTADTTQVDFVSLNVSSGTDLLLVSDIVNASGSGAAYGFICNNDSTITNYYHERFRVDDTSVSASRLNEYYFGRADASGSVHTNTYLSLTENGNFVYKAKNTEGYGGSGITIENRTGFNLSTITAINKLSITSNQTDGIGNGSNFKLYKLIAEPLLDTTLISDTTEINITGLGLTVGNELLLVSDVYGSGNIGVYPNGKTTITDYYKQQLSVNGSITLGETINNGYSLFCASNSYNLAHTYIKLTNAGYYAVQSYIAENVGESTLIHDYKFLVSTYTLTSIISIKIIAATTSGMKIGSRFKLYKLK